MKIDWLKYENKNHVMAWFILEAMSEAGIDKFGDFDSSCLEIELKVNGIEVTIVGPMEYLQEQLKDIEKNGIKKGIEKSKCILLDNIEKIFDIYEHMEE